MAIVQFNGFIPVLEVDYAAAVAVAILAIGLAYRFRAWIRVVPAGLFADARSNIHTSGMIGIFFSELGQRVLVQRLVFMDSQSRRAVHMMTFWGFVGLAFATVWDDIFYRNGVLPAPFTPENLGNVVGTIGGVLVLIGMTMMILRYALVEKFRESYKGDLAFFAVLYLATITGFTTEVTRFSVDSVAFSSYAIHLVFVGALVVTAPFTHFFHAVLTPFLRYVERLQTRLIEEGVSTYPFYRRRDMADLAEDVRQGRVRPAYPEWLRSKKSDEK